MGCASEAISFTTFSNEGIKTIHGLGICQLKHDNISVGIFMFQKLFLKIINMGKKLKN